MSLLVSCGSQVSDLELRVAKLETEIASMRKGGGLTSLVPAGAYPQFAFQEEEYNFGDIRDGDVVSHVFKFTNTGTAPLIFKRISSSCGCTIPKKPEKPIEPGESGEIEVEYDTKRVGVFMKAISVVSNSKNSSLVLRIKGKVMEEEEDDDDENNNI